MTIDSHAAPHKDWQLLRLGDHLKLQNGFAFKPAQWSREGDPIIRIQNLNSDHATYNRFNGDLPEKFRARHGDLLFAWSGTPGTSFGAHVWIGGDAWINQHIFRVEFSGQEFDRDFLRLALNYNLGSYIAQAQGGVGLAHITKAKLNESLLVAPPIKDQQRIARDSAATDRLNMSASIHILAARNAIERFRQAVLAAACSGRLTEDWRIDNTASAEELACQLREQHDGRRSESYVTRTSDFNESIPQSWEKISLGLLVDRIEAGKSVRALGRPANPTEWGVVKVSAMSWGQFREHENKVIVDDNLINPAYEIRKGDLLISRANTVDLVGATVLVAETRPRLLLSDKSLRLVLLPGIDKAWLNYALRSSLVRSQFSELATGTSDSMRNLSQPKILSTTIALPPTSEQREIARRTTVMLDMAERLLTRLDDAGRSSNLVSQAALAKAMRGELIPR